MIFTRIVGSEKFWFEAWLAKILLAKKTRMLTRHKTSLMCLTTNIYTQILMQIVILTHSKQLEIVKIIMVLNNEIYI